MKITPEIISALRTRHRTERDGRVKDRIKAVVLYYDEKLSIDEIATALLIKPTTVEQHLKDFLENEKLKPENGGSVSHLNEEQTAELARHLAENTYTNVASICIYIKDKYNIQYTVAGFTDWLKRNGFSYKEPKGTPAKADPEKQAAFIAKYEKLLHNTPHDEPILFGDGVHPTMATKISRGWIKTGTNKLIETTASRTRVNLFGSLNLENMEIVRTTHKTLNSQAMEGHFAALRATYPNAPIIHLLVDQGSYNKSKNTAQAAKKYGIKLHFLPSYSPNLNPAERVWKIMNEQCRNNVFFRSAKEFRKTIEDFFETGWKKIAQSMVDRVNDNFQTLKVLQT